MGDHASDHLDRRVEHGRLTWTTILALNAAGSVIWPGHSLAALALPRFARVSGTFGTREDECGPWTAGPDQTEAINAQRQVLRDERDRLEDRLAEIDAADRVAALRVDHPMATVGDLVAERARVRARLDEIHEHDTAVNRARARHYAGEAGDPAELDPPRYCDVQ